MSRYNRHTHSGRESESKRDRHRDRHRECGWETIMMCVGERKAELASSTQSAPMSPQLTHLVNSSALIVPEESMSYFSSISSSIESIALRPWLLGQASLMELVCQVSRTARPPTLQSCRPHSVSTVPNHLWAAASSRNCGLTLIGLLRGHASVD